MGSLQQLASSRLRTIWSRPRQEGRRGAELQRVERAPTLWAQGEGSAAIQLERLWDEVAKTCDVEILCGYVLTASSAKRKTTSTRESAQTLGGVFPVSA